MCSVIFKVGDRVRVKPSVTRPTYSWGEINSFSVGIVKEVKDDDDIIVDFPEQKEWTGIIYQMEHAKGLMGLYC